MFLHRLFDSVAVEFWDEGTSFARIASALGFEHYIEASADPDDTGMPEDDWFDLDVWEQEKICDAWNPSAPEGGWLLALKFIDEEGEMSACFVKPRTAYTAALWEFADKWEVGE